MLAPIRRILAPLFTNSPLSPPSQQRHMQEATDKLTQDAPHDIALGRCSFTGLQLTVTKTGVSRQQHWADWELCWAKAEIVAKRSDCDPYSTTEECANASRMPNDGRPWHKCRRSSSIGPWHGMLRVVAASVTVSLVKDITLACQCQCQGRTALGLPKRVATSNWNGGRACSS